MASIVGFYPTNTKYTDPESLVAEQDLTDAYADFGAEIDMRQYNRLGIFIATDVNNSEDVDLQVLGLAVSGGDAYTLDGTVVQRLWTGAGSDAFLYYEFDCATVPYLQLQAKAGTVGGTAGDLTISVNKKWRN